MENTFVFLHDFLKETVIEEFDFEEMEKNWLSQLKVRYESVENKLSTGNFLCEIRIKPRLIKDLTSRQKILIYQINRSISLIFDYNLTRIAQIDIENLFDRTTMINSDRYFYLHSLEDNQFLYEMDSLCYSKYSRNRLYSQIKNNYANLEEKILERYIRILKSLDFTLIPVKKPKRKIRHKGYRDHGSLGSEFSRTLRDQSSDYTILQKEEERRKKIQDRQLFLLGLGGWL